MLILDGRKGVVEILHENRLLIGGGAVTGLFFEHLGEVLHGGEAELIGNLAEGEFLLNDEDLGLFDLEIDLVFLDGSVEDVAEEFGDVALAIAKVAREIGELDVVAEVIGEVANRGIDNGVALLDFFAGGGVLAAPEREDEEVLQKIGDILEGTILVLIFDFVGEEIGGGIDEFLLFHDACKNAAGAFVGGDHAVGELEQIAPAARKSESHDENIR